MRKRRTMIGLVLIIAVLVLGVGYAIVSGVNLSINGSASTEDKTLQVVFFGSTTTDTNGTGATVTATHDNELNAEIQVTDLKKVGDSVTATYTIKNYESDLSASIVQGEITNSKSEFFSVTTDIATPKVVAAGATTTVTVTVSVIKLPIETEDSETTIEIPLEANPVQPT